MLTREEIQAANYRDTFEMLQALRPQWLRKRGTQSIMNEQGNEIKVYVNNMQLGGLDELRNVAPSDIERAEFLSAAATQRWGTGHTSGAILLVTRSGR